MNSIDDKGTWIEQKAKLKQKLIALLGNELKFEENKKDKVLEKLQIKLGKTKEEINSIINSL